MLFPLRNKKQKRNGEVHNDTRRHLTKDLITMAGEYYPGDGGKYGTGIYLSFGVL